MKLLIFGSQGQLGYELTRLASSHGFEAIGVDLPECDLTHWASVESTFAGAGGLSVVINAAAYTAVDAAEQNPQTAFAVNRDGAGHVARACRARALPMIQVSTDYVFDGHKTTAYHPYDPIHPLSVYGCSKAEGEALVRQHLEHHVIVRTAWLFGRHGQNFVKTMIRLGREREEIRVVDDQIGCPTYAGDLAAALLTAAAMASRNDPVWGTYHFCNQGVVTWYAFTRRIIALAKSHEPLAVKEIIPILSSQYPQVAHRPPCSILDCTSFEQIFNFRRRPWNDALKEMLRELFAAPSPLP